MSLFPFRFAIPGWNCFDFRTGRLSFRINGFNVVSRLMQQFIFLFLRITGNVWPVTSSIEQYKVTVILAYNLNPLQRVCEQTQLIN